MEGFSNATLNEMAHSTMLGSLLTVWVLVGLFFYLNHYTRRRYFTIWATAWLFYALWLTQILRAPEAAPGEAGRPVVSRSRGACGSMVGCSS